MQAQRALNRNESRGWVCVPVSVHEYRLCTKSVCVWIVRKAGVELVSLGKKRWETMLENGEEVPPRSHHWGCIHKYWGCLDTTVSPSDWSLEWEEAGHMSSLPSFPATLTSHFLTSNTSILNLGMLGQGQEGETGMPWKTSHTNALLICLWSWLISFPSQFDYFFFIKIRGDSKQKMANGIIQGQWLPTILIYRW